MHFTVFYKAKMLTYSSFFQQELFKPLLLSSIYNIQQNNLQCNCIFHQNTLYFRSFAYCLPSLVATPLRLYVKSQDVQRSINILLAVSHGQKVLAQSFVALIRRLSVVQIPLGFHIAVEIAAAAFD